MPTRPYSVVFDAADPRSLARFWADALRWAVVTDRPGEAEVVCDAAPPWSDGGPPRLLFDQVDEPTPGKNRVHLDLASSSLEEQRAIVGRVRDLGAREVDIGQRDVPWVVLADPEGNEFCVLDPRETYVTARGLAAVIIDCADAPGLAGYWAAATGWPVVARDVDYVAFGHPAGSATRLELLAVPDAKQGKNRLHVDLVALPGDEVAAEVRRLEQAGARRIDIGQGQVPWTVLADPEGNEHCLLDLV